MTHSKRTELSRSADRYSSELASIGNSIKLSLHRTKNFTSPKNFNSSSSHFGWPQQQLQKLHKSDIIAYNRPMESRSFKSIEEEYQLQKQSKILRSPVGNTSQDANKDNNLSKKPATHREKPRTKAYASNLEEDQYLLRKENEKFSSSGKNERNTQKPDNRKAIISNLQKQLNDNQSEFEMLRNQNILIESLSNVSNEESLIYKMQNLEAENLKLKNELDRVMKEIKIREENKHVNERFQALSEENKQLANKLSGLKRTHDTMDPQFEEHVQVEGAINHARAANQRSQPKPNSNGFRMTPENRPFNQENTPNYSSNPQSTNQLVTPRGAQEKDRFANLPNPVHYFPADPYFPSDLDARFSDSHTIAEEKTAHHIAKQKPREMIFESPKQPIRATATAISTEVVKGGSVTRTTPQPKSNNNLVFNFKKSSVNTVENLSKQEIPSEIMSRGQLSSKLNSAKKDASKHDTMLQSPPIQVSRSSIRDTTANQERHASNYIETHENADMILQNDSETQSDRNRYTEPESNRKNAPEARATKNRDYDVDWARKTLQEERPGQRELDHNQPTEPTQQHKLNEKSTASEVDIIDELKNRLLEDPSPDSLHYFKMGCLKNKFVIFENEFMQIGASSNHFQDQVRIVLFFDSKIDEEITRFSTYLIGGLNLEVVLKPEKIDPIIVPGRQTKQMILLSLIDIPISCLKMSCQGFCGDQEFEFSFFLPTMINKFMDLKTVEPEDFHEYWESNYQSVLRSDVFEIDSAIVKKAADFDKYIANLIDVGLDDESILIKNQENIKIGAVFELKNLDSDYAIKIHFSESQQAVFEIATSGENLEGAKFILQSLIFLFEQ